ncbi:Phytase-like domain containing protein [Rhabdaerophilaceae bacterium]
MAGPTRRAVLAGLGAAWGLSGIAHAQSERDPFAWRTVAVKADAFSGFSVLEPARRQFGPMTFLGGLELQGDLPEFGGISGAIIDPDGRGFVAISDQAHWITGRFLLDADERLTGIEAVRLAAMVAPNGRRMKSTRFYDTEGLTRVGNRLYVSVERIHQIVRFELGAQGPGGRGVVTAVPAAMAGLTANQGVEALGVMPAGSRSAGALIAIAEHAPKGASSEDIPGWLIGGPVPGQFLVKRMGAYDVTDLAFLPDGDMLILERSFSPLWGVAFRIRRIALNRIVPDAILDGPTLIEANMAYQVDNMEALMIHRAADGRTIITLMSDNNFSILQRNLVLRFAYYG